MSLTYNRNCLRKKNRWKVIMGLIMRLEVISQGEVRNSFQIREKGREWIMEE
jgi:hypothetical protein